MGYSLTPVAVDFGKVTGVLGSGKKGVARKVCKRFGSEFEQFDEMAAEYAEDEDGLEELTMCDTIMQMVMGEKYHEHYDFMYGYALEFFCRHFGKFLSNEEWSAMPSGSQWAETVDEGLTEPGVPSDVLRVVNHLIFRGAPVTFPEIDDFPCIGYLRINEIKAAEAALGEA